MGEKPPPPEDDDYRERDISEDPFLAAVDADLNSANRRNDYKLGIAIAVLLAAAFLYDRTGLKRPSIDAVGVVVVLGVIGLTIFRTVREKKNVAVKYGLRCRVCGYTPGPHMVLSAATIERCAKCGNRLRQ